MKVFRPWLIYLVEIWPTASLAVCWTACHLAGWSRLCYLVAIRRRCPLICHAMAKSWDKNDLHITGPSRGPWSLDVPHKRPVKGKTSLLHYTIIHTKHDDVIKLKHFPRYWPFVRVIHRSPVNSLHKGQWRRALVFSLICFWIHVE